nr:hypothetical protein [uncultured Rhodopila sp.]
MRGISLIVALLLLPLSCLAETRTNPVQSPPGKATLPGVLRNMPACRPGSAEPACQAAGPKPQRRTDDVKGTRYVPPAIQAFLADRRLDPYTRAFLRGLAAKPTEQWTQGELPTVTQLVPSLTEMAIPTRKLSDFYEFLGLRPDELFEPQLGNWQTKSIGFDQRNYDAVQQAQCFYLLGYGENIDPSSVKLKDLAACTTDDRQ